MRIAAVTAQEPLSGQTLLLNEADDEAVFKDVVRSSREKYAKKVVTKEQAQKNKVFSTKSTSQNIKSRQRHNKPTA